MKSTLKIVLVFFVIFVLVASYVLTGKLGSVAPQRTASVFQGPTGKPSTNGPTTPPPVSK